MSIHEVLEFMSVFVREHQESVHTFWGEGNVRAWVGYVDANITIPEEVSEFFVYGVLYDVQDQADKVAADARSGGSLKEVRRTNHTVYKQCANDFDRVRMGDDTVRELRELHEYAAAIKETKPSGGPAPKNEEYADPRYESSRERASQRWREARASEAGNGDQTQWWLSVEEIGRRTVQNFLFKDKTVLTTHAGHRSVLLQSLSDLFMGINQGLVGIPLEGLSTDLWAMVQGALDASVEGTVAHPGEDDSGDEEE
ncbi:uncharacterized protein KRP23_11129 [Phytophthora ramorum]|uniref:Uncharacterized protein n=1 Tax=Phytophthora ramorum TaxID=164328 RepID=H3H8V0_PHYRM|nr:hypothetical protein KRP23_11129 [Phytophthora ramorum]